MAERMRARADERHRPLQYVEELRELVDRGPADKSPDAGHARVLARCLLHANLRHPLMIHRPELVDVEALIVEAKARLAEQDRPRAVELDRDRDRYQKRREDDQTDACQDHILRSEERRVA